MLASFYEERMACPVCGGADLIYDYSRGEIVCTSCGLVVAENLVDPGPEWRGFEGVKGRERARVGPPVDLAFDLTTSLELKDARGTRLALGRKLKSIRLANGHRKISMARGDRLGDVAQELERLRSAMGAPKQYAERALEIYRKAQEDLQGRSAEAIAAAALYMAYRAFKTPRPLREFIRYTRAPEREVARCVNSIAMKLRLPPPTAADYVRMAAARLGLDAKTMNTAIELTREIRNASPLLVAAVAIVRASNKSVAEVANAVGISPNTLKIKLRAVEREAEAMAKAERAILKFYPLRKNAVSLSSHASKLELKKIGEAASRRAAARVKRATRRAVKRRGATPAERAVLGPYLLRRKSKNVFILYGAAALELAYNLREAGLLDDAELAKIETRVTRNRRNWYVTVKRHILEEVGAKFTEGSDVAADYISVAAFELGLDGATVSKAVEIARKVRDVYPRLAAAVAIYIAAGRTLTADEVARATKASRRRLVKMAKELGALVLHGRLEPAIGSR